MKRIQVAVLGFLLISGSALANECIAGKKFKIRAACGRVGDPAGGRVSGVELSLHSWDEVANKTGTEALATTESRAEGVFNFGPVKAGEYVLIGKMPEFPSLWQPLKITNSKGDDRCRTPIVVVMMPGGCSSTRNAWKK